MKHNHQHSESIRFKQNQRKTGVTPQGNLNFISFVSLLDPQWSANLTTYVLLACKQNQENL